MAALRVSSEECVDKTSEVAHRPQLVLRQLMRVEVEIRVRVSRTIPVVHRHPD